MTSAAARLWSVLIHYNPRLINPPADWLAIAEWQEAGLAADDSRLAAMMPVAIKLDGLDAAEHLAAGVAASQRDVWLGYGQQGRQEPVLLTGPRGAIEAVVAALDAAGCADLALAVRDVLNAGQRSHWRISVRGGRELIVGERPLVMGILNVTPDSFSDGGAYYERSAAIEQGLALTAAGADLIDVGGESTRPGAPPVPEEEEIRRVLPVIEGLLAAGSAPSSVDTSKAAVARRCVEAGAVLVNDITGLFGDAAMAATVAELGVPVCVMHIQGTPRTMQANPHYDDLMGEIILALRRSMAHGIAAGIPEDAFLVDPGIGFGKTVEHNLAILNRLGQLRSLGRPVLVGTSRKSFIGKVLGKEIGDGRQETGERQEVPESARLAATRRPPEGSASSSSLQPPATNLRPPAGRAFGTAATVAAAVLRGAHVLRVHDVADTVDVVKMISAITRE